MASRKVAPKVKAAPLPCPFCGATPLVWKENYRPTPIWCVTCPDKQWHDCGSDGFTKVEAIANWNRRLTPVRRKAQP